MRGSNAEAYDEVLMSVDNHAYTWDMKTGDLVAETGCVSGIVSFFVAQENSVGYLAERGGTIQIADLRTGVLYAENAIETGKNLRQVEIKNGVLALRAYESPDITLMKYQEGTGIKKCSEFDLEVEEIVYSKDESYYAVDLYANESDYEVYFYRSADGEFAGSWNIEDAGFVVNCGFVDDATYALVCSDGVIYYYNIEKQETTEFELESGWSGGDGDVNTSCTWMFLHDNGRYGIVDLVRRKMLCEGEQTETITGGVVAEDGKMAYFCTESGVCQLDTESGKITAIELGGHYVLPDDDVTESITISMDGTYLAIICEDGIIRVYNTKTKEVSDEIPLIAQKRKYIEFSSDGKALLMQGDDYYFRVYDLEKQEFSYVATEQYYEIKRSVMDEETGTICLLTTVDMRILNQEDYKCIAHVEEGRIYLPKHEKVLCSNYGTLYEFPYMTLEMLQKEAKRQFGEDALSELERTQYHVE